jgi:hypothetical protein
MHKKLKIDDYIETEGPMNQVSKQDAMVWTQVENLETADEQQRRIVHAKLKKAKRSTKKHDRHMNHRIIDVIRNDDNEI